MWAACVLATAYCTVPAADEVRHTEQAAAAKAEVKHRSPWAKDN